jgi:hypothetical protein
MTNIMPEGAMLRKAVQWISKMREEGGKTSLPSLIDQACIRFNLSPKDGEFLTRFLADPQTPGAKAT